MGDRKYPRILEIAVRAGRWSFIAGSSAAVMSGTGCGGDSSPGVVELDAHGLDAVDAIEDQREYWPELLGIWIEDIGTGGVQDAVDAGPGFELAGDDAGNGGYDDSPPGLTFDTYYEIDTGSSDKDVVGPDVVETDPGMMGDPPSDAYLPHEDVVEPEIVESDAVVDVEDEDYFLSGGAPVEDV